MCRSQVGSKNHHVILTRNTKKTSSAKLEVHGQNINYYSFRKKTSVGRKTRDPGSRSARRHAILTDNASDHCCQEGPAGAAPPRAGESQSAMVYPRFW